MLKQDEEELLNKENFMRELREFLGVMALFLDSGVFEIISIIERYFWVLLGYF